MVNRSHTAVLEKNLSISGVFATEPYEIGWAKECVLFVRTLNGEFNDSVLMVQISPDGIHWVDEGTTISLKKGQELAFTKIEKFGNWIRIRGETLNRITVIITLSMKE